MKPDAVQIRVLGCLLEKQRTTPDAYPLSLNALRVACNQATNRDPVVEYDDRDVRGALDELGRRRWTRSASGPGSRAPKFRHLLNDTLGVTPDEQAVLAVLLLRGPQTPGELRQRTDRMHAFADFGELEATIARLVERGLVERLERRPGQKESRYRQLLGGDQDPSDRPAVGGAADAHATGGPGEGAPVGGAGDAAEGPEVAADTTGGPGAAAGSRPATAGSGSSPATAAMTSEIVALRGRVEALESEVARLRAAFRRLQEG
ncbi:MAG: YceH family protein [Solirubrobacteraceae bacterium]|nr:YceH family protein [Solirubrobacteraceae bacterium]